jgi:hypothetical protein
MGKLSDEQLARYFNEHVLYELLMLRYTRERLMNEKMQLAWNAMFSTFNVSARNLYNFLRGNGGQNEVDIRDFSGVTAKPPLKGREIEEIKGPMNSLHAQCLHMGTDRTTALADKINLEQISKVFDYIDAEMRDLINSFESCFKSKISVERSDPRTAQGLNLQHHGPTGPAAPSATNYPEIQHTTISSGLTLRHD